MNSTVGSLQKALTKKIRYIFDQNKNRIFTHLGIVSFKLVKSGPQIVTGTL